MNTNGSLCRASSILDHLIFIMINKYIKFYQYAPSQYMHLLSNEVDHLSKQDFLKIFGGHILFMGPLIPLLWTCGDICLGFQNQGGSHFCVLSHLCDSQIYLWCDTCWLYRGQHGSQAFSIYMLADVFPSIGGGLGPGLEPTTVCATRYLHAVINLLLWFMCRKCIKLKRNHFHRSYWL